MIRHVIPVFAVLLAAILTGCGTSEYVLKPTGDIAKVTTDQDGIIIGELLSIQDSTIYLVTDYDTARPERKAGGAISSCQIAHITSIEIEGYSDRSWVTSVLLLEGVPTILLTAAASSAKANAGSVFLAFSIPTVLTWIAFEASTPAPPKADFPVTSDKLADLKKYSRFPQGLTPDNLDKLRKMYK
jgi:hypothetical protein